MIEIILLNLVFLDLYLHVCQVSRDKKNGRLIKPDAMENDIKTREDIEVLIKRFYDKVQTDALLSPLFNHVDWQKHLPVMYCFWSSMILGEQSYQGSPFQKHIRLPLDHIHFHQWLMLFHATVDEMFTGEKAEEIKSRAQSIAGVFQHKLGILVSST